MPSKTGTLLFRRARARQVFKRLRLTIANQQAAFTDPPVARWERNVQLGNIHDIGKTVMCAKYFLTATEYGRGVVALTGMIFSFT